MCEDAGIMLRDYLYTLTDVTDLVGDHLYGIGDAPGGDGAYGVQCVEIDADRFSEFHLRTALVQLTVFSIDKEWNRNTAGVILDKLKRFNGFMGSRWVTVSHEDEIETSEQIGAVYRWAYSIDLTLRYK